MRVCYIKLITRTQMRRPIMKILAILFLSCTILAMVPSCSNNSTSAPIPEPFFPSLNKPLNAYPAGLATGKLILDNRCLRLEGTNGESLLIVWPYGFSARVESNKVLIINEKGEVVTSVGKDFAGGGGEVPRSIVEELMGQSLPDNCPGPYWLLSEVEKNPFTDNEMASLTNVPSPSASELETYIKQFGVSVTEAARQIRIQKTAGALDSIFRNREKETYSGLWIEHSPEFRVVIQFKYDAQNTYLPYSYYLVPDLRSSIILKTVGYSLVQLEQAQLEVSSSLHTLGIQADSEIDIAKNRVIINVKSSDRANFENAIRDGKLVLPDSVEVIWTDSLATPA